MDDVRKMMLGLMMVLCLAFASADGALLVYEGFNYDGMDEGNAISGMGSASDGWAGAWDSGSGFVLGGTGLDMNGYGYDTVGYSAYGKDKSTTVAVRHFGSSSQLDLSVDATYYISLMVQLSEFGSGSQYFNMEFRTAENSRQFTFGATSTRDATLYDLGERVNAVGACDTTDVMLLVCKIEASAAGNDQAFLSVFHGVDAFSGLEPASWDITGTAEANDSVLERIRIVGGYDTAMAFDEIRIGTEWGDVVPEPLSLVLLGLGGLFAGRYKRQK